LPSISSMRSNLSRSPSSMRDTGMPVHFDTTVAISVTTGTTTVRAELEWDGDKFVLVPVPVPIWNLVIDTKAGTDAYATQCSLGPE